VIPSTSSLTRARVRIYSTDMRGRKEGFATIWGKWSQKGPKENKAEESGTEWNNLCILHPINYQNMSCYFLTSVVMLHIVDHQ